MPLSQAACLLRCDVDKTLVSSLAECRAPALAVEPPCLFYPASAASCPVSAYFSYPPLWKPATEPPPAAPLNSNTAG